MSKVVLLLDDERSFADNRPAIVARTVAEAIDAVADLDYVDELWLDYVLSRGDTTPFLYYLIDRSKEGNPLKVGRVIFHSSAYLAKSLIDDLASDAGLPDVELAELGTVSLKEIK